MSISEILLILFILNLGTAFGAGLYETRIVLPLWFTKTTDGNYRVNFETMHATDTGRKFWGFITTMPLTLLTIANFIVAFQSSEPIHGWWLGATIFILLERLGTFTFFIPTAIKLQRGENLSESKITSLVSWWIRLNYVRNIFTLVAWLLALKSWALI
jgi:Domain of unknown function (DUF1772)